MYQALNQIDALISEKEMDLFRTRGRISLQVGFMVGLISPETPDDDEKLSALLDAVEEILGERIHI